MAHLRRHCFTLAFLTMALGLCIHAQAQGIDELLTDYAGNDPAVSREARLALEALVAAQSAPDADEREEVTEALLDFIAEGDAPTDRLCYIVRLVAVCGKNEAVGPLAGLLGDAELGEQARQALCSISGAAATEALIEALRAADGDATVPFAHALGTRRDRAAVGALIAVAESGTPSAQIAALGALGRIGDPAATDVALRHAEEGDGDVQAAAIDTLLRLAEGRMDSDRDGARELYEAALRCAPTDNLRTAALVGIRAIGDPASLPEVLGSIGGTDRVLLQSTVACVRELAGGDVVGVLQDAYATASVEAKGLLLQGIAVEAGAAAAPMLIEALSDPEPTICMAAATALNRQVVPEAAEALLAVAESGDEVAKPIALSAYLKVLQVDRDGKGRQFAHALAIATRDEERRVALSGLAGDATADDYDLVEPLTRRDATRQAALDAYLAIGLSLIDTDTDRAQEILTQVIQRGANRWISNRAAQGLRQLGIEVNLAREAGFVVDWRVVGPLPQIGDFRSHAPLASAADVDTDAELVANGTKHSWKHIRTDDLQGMYDFDAVLGHAENCMAFAFTRVRSDAARDVVLRMGSDDGIVCWVNGELVHANNAARPVGIDQDSANAHLEAGENTILLKITQGGGGWGYCLRITDEDGQPVRVEPIP